jgi:protein-tyrosine phosphatase
MRNGKPHLLVVGAADTGRAPLLAGLLRQALGNDVLVTSAGVLAHVGEPADASVGMALEQLDIRPVLHTARQLDGEASHDADVIVAIDQGTARVATQRLGREVLSINQGNAADDVQDPHRMPLGVWIAAIRAYQTQIEQILPRLRERLGRVEVKQDAPEAIETDAPSITPTVGAGTTTASRAEHVAHIGRLFATVEVLPEIVDWSRLTEETTSRLRSLAELTEAPDDYTLAAALIVIGLLSQTPRMPPKSQITTLREITERLASPVDAQQLIEIARIVST